MGFGPRKLGCLASDISEPSHALVAIIKPSANIDFFIYLLAFISGLGPVVNFLHTLFERYSPESLNQLQNNG